MASHIHDVTKSAATPLCGATSGVCVDAERARCPACLALDKVPATGGPRVIPDFVPDAGSTDRLCLKAGRGGGRRSA